MSLLHHWVDVAVHRWIGYKSWLIHHVGLTNDAMHVHAAFILLLISALVLRKRPDHILPWLVVLVAELANEYADIVGDAPGESTYAASVHDIYNTMFWPTIFLVFGWLLFPRPKMAEQQSNELTDQAFKEPPSV